MMQDTRPVGTQRMSFAVPAGQILSPGWAPRAAAVLLAVFASACSALKPIPSERQGLFDVFASLESGSDRDWTVDPNLDANHAQANRMAKDWQWPLKKISITSMYGKRGRRFHEGVDLRAPSGTPVFAAADGEVMYSGARISGYGKMVVVKHDKDLVTVYAHNSKNLVRKGEKVKRGQKIALSGNTGRTSGPHLHFEVRSGVQPLDPMMILPEPPYLASGSTARRNKDRGVAAKGKSEVGI